MSTVRTFISDSAPSCNHVPDVNYQDQSKSHAPYSHSISTNENYDVGNTNSNTSHTHPTSYAPSTSPTSSMDTTLSSGDKLATSFMSDPVLTAGILTPALAIVPEIRTVECLYEYYRDLQGEENDLILAAAHIDDARTGRGRYGKAKYYFKQKPAQMAFKVITNKWFQRLIHSAVLLHSMLTFIEPPSVPPQSTETYVAVCLNLVCLSVYLFDIMLNIVFLSWRVFWAYEEQSWNRVQFVLLCCFVVDWILLLAQVASGNNDIVQPFRCLRLAMVVCKAKNVGHITNVVKSITVKLGGVVFIVLVFILLYSCIGVHLVMLPYIEIQEVNISAFRPPSLEGLVGGGFPNETVALFETCSTAANNDTNIYEGTFNHIGTALYQLFILLTTENYPVFMFPAFFVSQWYFVYFGTFLVFGVFFITSILLAIIADLYWQYNKKHLKKERAQQRAELVKAWKILDTMGQERLSVDDKRLLKLFKLLKPENSDNENRALIAELDPDQTGWVDWIFWVTQLLSILALEKAVHHSTGKDTTTNTYVVALSRVAHMITACVWFDKMVLFMIILHSLLFAVKWAGMSTTVELAIQGLRTVIVTIFLVEMCFRLTDRGRHFFSNLINSLDFSLVVVALFGNVLWYAILSPVVYWSVEPFLWRGSFVVTSSVAVFMRLFLNSKQSRQVMNVFFRLIPVMLDLMILFGIVLYFYGVLGMESFHSFRITENTPDANHLQYGCGLGFENFKCSLFILFQILTTSNWHEIMNTVIISLNSYAPVIYFIPCYIVINLIIMNLLVAIGIEAFNKFSQEQKDEENEEESQLPSSTHPASESRTLREGVVQFGRKILTGLGSFAKVMLSSARIVEEEQNATVRIDVQSCPSSKSMTNSLSHMTDTCPLSDHVTSGYSVSSTSPETNTEDISNPVVYTNHSIANLQDIKDSVSVEVSSGQNQAQPITSVAMMRQEKRKLLLKEKQKQLRMKRLGNAVTAAVLVHSQGSGKPESTTAQGCDTASDGCDNGWSTESVHDSDRTSHPGSSHKWMQATNAISFISQVNNSSATEKFDSEQKVVQGSHDQFSSGPKFKRGHNHGNWRSEVQNITIINKEEFHELRKQLAAKPSIFHKKRHAPQSSIDSPDSLDHGCSRRRKLSLQLEREKCSNDWSQDSTLTLTQLELHNLQGDKYFPLSDHPPSTMDHFISQQKLPSDTFPPYLSRRRSSILSIDSVRSLVRRFSSPRHSLELDLSTPPIEFNVSVGSQEKGNASNITPKIDACRDSLDFNTSANHNSNDQRKTVKKCNRSGSNDEEECFNDESLDDVSDLPFSATSSFDKDGEIRNNRVFFKAPLISVEEVVEPAESPVSDSRPESRKLSASPRAQKKALIGSRLKGARDDKEMPEWVKKLTQQYNVMIHTDSTI